MRTAQIDSATGFVFAVTSSHLDPAAAPVGVTFVPIADTAPEPLGQTWDGAKFNAPALAHTEDAFTFKSRFTPQERVAIRAAAVSDAYTDDFMDMLNTAAAVGKNVVFGDVLVLAGLQHLVDTGVIGKDRAQAILVP